METDYTKIKINPIFSPVKKLFEFYILGIGFIGRPEFQSAFLKVHPGISPLINDYNKEVDLKVENGIVKTSTYNYLVHIGRVMAIAIFDFLQFSRYNAILGNTEIYRFAKHIRNGAAHNNRFDIRKPEELINKPAKWRDKSISVDLIGKQVIPDYITPTELLLLTGDISSLIR